MDKINKLQREINEHQEEISRLSKELQKTKEWTENSQKDLESKFIITSINTDDSSTTNYPKRSIELICIEEEPGDGEKVKDMLTTGTPVKIIKT